MKTNRISIDDLIDELIKTNKLDELIEAIETEGINIDKDIDTSNVIKSLGRDIYPFDIKDKKYELIMDWMMLQNKKIFVDVNFQLKNLKQLKNLPTTNSHIETSITNTGDAKKVFDVVVSMSVKIILNKNPDYVTFQAREEKRQRTYKYMIKQILRKINNRYREVEISPLTNERFDSDEFWLEKV